MEVRKIAALVLAAVMAMPAIAGCKAGSGTKQKSSAPMTVDWLAYNTYGQPDESSPIIQTAEKKYNLKFNFWFVDDQQWNQVLGVKLASGNMPDMLKIPDTSVIPQYVSMGVLTPITDSIMKKIPNVDKQLKKYAGTDYNLDGIYKGKQYVIKNPIISGAYPTVVVWRTDWLRNVGISSMPTSLSDWETALLKFRNEDPDKDGKQDTYGISNTAIGAVFGAYGGIPLKEYRGTGNQFMFWVKSGNQYTLEAIQPEMKDALTTLAKWYKEGIIDPEFVTGENTGGYWAESQAFENGRIGVTGMDMSTHWNAPLYAGGTGGVDYRAFLKSNPKAQFGETFDIGKPPVGPKGKSGTYCWGAVSTSGFAFTTKLAKDSAKMDTVLRMINDYMGDEKTYTYYAHGIEGTHYQVDSTTGQLSITSAYSNSGTLVKAGVGVLTPFNNGDFDKKANPLIYQFMDKYKNTGYTNLLVPNTDATKKYMADLQTLTLNTYVKIITGSEPVSYFDTFVKTFNEKGGSEVIKSVNDALSSK